ncbi:MAG: plasmid replication initiator protein, partial [Actinobacteria bacterium]
TLGEHWPALRRWAHMLGFRGHFLTKARAYSVTFQLLRDQRVVWRRTEHATGPVDGEDTTLIISALAYIGAGWRTLGDALLANTAAALARERHQIAREELANEQGQALSTPVPIAA